MIWIVLGLAVWIGVHVMKRAAPGLHGRLGGASKPVVALGAVGAIALMTIGYKAAEPTFLWSLGNWSVHLNNLAMLIAVFLFGLGSSKSRLRGKLRHPMLTGTIVWSLAHLLVNGDVPSLILFGGIGLWALLAMRLINAAEPAPEPFEGGSLAGDIRLAVITLVVFSVIALVHGYVGPSPFGKG